MTRSEDRSMRNGHGLAGNIISLVILLSVAAGISAGPAEAATAYGHFQTHQGQYFRWAAPAGWRSSETISGVDISSPDRKAGVSFALLMRSHGNITPKDFLIGMLRRIPGYGNFKVVAIRNLPNQPSGIPGTYWQVIEAELSYSVSNMPLRGIWTCGINRYYGMYDASIVGYQSAADQWEQNKFYLSDMARKITITNPRTVAGNDTLIPVRNNPLDNSGIIGSGKLRDQARDRASKGQREGMMGQERVKDPETGRIYTMPLEKYDPTVGGYRNPQRPDEILVPTKPGE